MQETRQLTNTVPAKGVLLGGEPGAPAMGCSFSFTGRRGQRRSSLRLCWLWSSHMGRNEAAKLIVVNISAVGRLLWLGGRKVAFWAAEIK